MDKVVFDKLKQAQDDLANKDLEGVKEDIVQALGRAKNLQVQGTK